MNAPTANPDAMAEFSGAPCSAIASATAEDQARIMSVLERWARDNPRWTTGYGVEQDPMGVHALLARLRSPNISNVPQASIEPKLRLGGIQGAAHDNRPIADRATGYAELLEDGCRKNVCPSGAIRGFSPLLTI